MKKALGKFLVFLLGVSLIVGIVYVVLKYQDLKFRNVVVNEVKGRVAVSGGAKNGTLIAGEHLVDGDYVEVAKESALTLCADSNKYLRADPETSFKIETGNILTGKGVRIVMDSGSTLSTLDEKLKEGEFWQVDTPTSTMAVRGTSFRVTVYKSGTQKAYTLLEVEKGSVKVSLAGSDGKFTGEEIFEVGESAVIRKSEKKDASFIKSRTGDIKWDLDYDALPEESVERLVTILEDAGEQLEPQPEPEPEPVPQNTDEGPHVHSAGDWEVTTAKTCTSNGTRVRRCTGCGEILESEIIPAGHEFETTYSYPNGCTENGTATLTCRLCGETHLEPAYPRTHELDFNQSREGTGGSLEVLCTVCGQYVSVAAPSPDPPSIDDPDDPASQSDGSGQDDNQSINNNAPSGYDPGGG